MARPPKIGADYFPLDADIFQDRKIMVLRNSLGFPAISVYLALLCNIYKEHGYFMQYDECDGSLIAEWIGGGCTAEFVDEVVICCFKSKLFDENLYNKYHILTSKGVQSRFLRICEYRKTVLLCSEYVLVDTNSDNLLPQSMQSKINFFSVNQEVNSVNQEVNSVNHEVNSVNREVNSVNQEVNPQSKVKEIKSKSKSSSSESKAPPNIPSKEIIRLFPNSVKREVAEQISAGLIEWLEIFPSDIIKMAINISLEYNAFNLRYICKVLSNWKINGLKSCNLNNIASAEQIKVKKSKFANYNGRNWDFNRLEELASNSSDKMYNEGDITNSDMSLSEKGVQNEQQVEKITKHDESSRV